MEKRLTRSDYIYIFIVIFMLICAMGAFFYGIKVGNNQAEAKYTKLLKKYEEKASGLPAYDQSYLASFYHTIFSPYKEFESKWFKRLDDLELSGGSSDASAAMKDLSKSAQDAYNALEGASTPESSPLLKEAHENYMKGLKLFVTACKSFQAKANKIQIAELEDAINSDAYFTETRTFTLNAQKQFFEAIVMWNKSVDAELKGQELLNNNPITIKNWNTLNVNLKNMYLAAWMADTKMFTSYLPHDLTIRIDEMIKSGQAKKLKLDNVQQVVEIVNGTGAVRSGDFINGKAKMYEGDPLPQIPFFFGQH